MLPFLLCTAAAMDNLYPKLKVNQWTAVEPQVNNTNHSTGNWSLQGNFYVVTDSKNANLKLGVSLGI